MLSRRNFLTGSALLVSAAAVSGRRGRRHSRGAELRLARHAAAAAAAFGSELSAGGDAERLDAALAHERRVEGVPSRRRGGRRARSRPA